MAVPGPLLSEHDLYLLAEGTFRRPYERLGAHPVTRDGVAGTRFAVWAPSAVAVAVRRRLRRLERTPGEAMTRRGATGHLGVLRPRRRRRAALQVPHRSPGRGAGRGQGRSLRPARRGPARHRLRGPRPGRPARLPLDGRGVGGRAARAPAPRPAPLDLRGAPRLLAARPGGGQPAPDLPRAGRAAAALRARPGLHPRRADAGHRVPLRRLLGVPGLGYYAPTARYGAPEDLQAFVDACHAARPGGDPGLGAGPLRQGGARAGPLRRHATSTSTPTRASASTPSGARYIFDYGRAEVRNFLLGSARFWLEEYHIDGFRVDAVASMIWLDHARPESHWGTNRHGRAGEPGRGRLPAPPERDGARVAPRGR